MQSTPLERCRMVLKFVALPGLRSVLLEQSEAFVSTVTEKLMSYALGRRLEYFDQPAVRQVVGAAAGDYRWSSIVVGIVQSPSFKMRQVLGEPQAGAE